MVWAVSLLTTDLITRCLTAEHVGVTFAVWLCSVPRDGAITYSVLYLHATYLDASPKAISGRTSYLRVRLEFLRYPHLIRQLFNGGRFGPPVTFTLPSTWTWIGHPVSGLLQATRVLFILGFPSASDLKSLTSLLTITRRTILQKVPHRTLTCFVCL